MKQVSFAIDVALKVPKITEVVMKNHKYTMKCEKCGLATSVMVSVPRRRRRASGEIICFMNVCPSCPSKIKK